MAATLIQTANPTAGTGSLTASLTATQPGSLILVFIGCSTNLDTVITPTDNAGNTYSIVYTSTANSSCKLYATRNAAATTSVSSTYIGTSDIHSVIVREYSGAAQYSGVKDRNLSTNDITTAVDTGATAATRDANELVVASCVYTVASPTLSAGSGYGNLVTNNYGGTAAIFGVEDKLVTTTGAQNGTFTGNGVSPVWDAGVATFFLDSGKSWNMGGYLRVGNGMSRNENN